MVSSLSALTLCRWLRKEKEAKVGNQGKVEELREMKMYVNSLGAVHTDEYCEFKTRREAGVSC